VWNVLVRRVLPGGALACGGAFLLALLAFDIRPDQREMTLPQVTPPSPVPTPVRPTSDTSGVPRAGRPLQASGPLTVGGDGTVVTGLRVDTEINVIANDVVIRDVELVGAGEWGIIQRKGFSGLRVENVEIHGDGKRKLQFGILNQGGMMTVRRTTIHTVSDGIGTDHGLIEECRISRLKAYPGDHVVAIASNGGPAPGLSLVIRRNVLLNALGQTSAVSIYQDFSRAHDVTLEDNLLAGGGYTLYGGGGRFGRPTNIKIINNRFSRRYFAGGGAFGPVTSFVPGRGNVWRGNRWTEGGGSVLP
jgi:hypothetical protein